jgi:hypothetical protein
MYVCMYVSYHGMALMTACLKPDSILLHIGLTFMLVAVKPNLINVKLDWSKVQY